MELKKNELCEEKLEQVTGGVAAEDHNVMLTEFPSKDFDTDIQTGDLEKVKDNGKLL